MAGQPIKIPNISFEKYAYHILVNLSIAQLQGLTTEERIMIGDERALQDFCKKQAHVKIDMLLQKIGVYFVRIYYSEDETDAIDSVIFNTANQYQFPEKRSDLIQAMVEHKVYVTSSRELIAATLMMSQNSSTKLYQITQQSRDIAARHKLNLKKEKLNVLGNIPTTQEMLEETKQAYAGFNKLLLEHLNSFDYLIQVLNLHQHELRILSALYTDPYNSKSLNELAQETKLGDKRAYLKKNADHLEEEGFIASDRTAENRKYNKKVFYLLTAKGIKAVVEYIQYLHKKSYG